MTYLTDYDFFTGLNVCPFLVLSKAVSSISRFYDIINLTAPSFANIQMSFSFAHYLALSAI